MFPIEELILFPKDVDSNCSFFVNIRVNNLRKTPVLQLKQSNLPLALYLLLNEQFLHEKHALRHTCQGFDN